VRVRRALVLGIAGVVLAGLTACASTGRHASPVAAHVSIPADLPPSPATWPKYPHFSRHSGWGRPGAFGKHPRALLTRLAPSYAPPARAHPIPPAVVARRLLARLGDGRYVRAIRFLSALPEAGNHIPHADDRPPADVLKAEIVLRDLHFVRDPSAERSLTNGIAQYEGGIVEGALRDDLCDAGGAPLAGESWWALDQRFPNPTPAAFRKRVALAGQRFGFTVASLRLLRPRQLAPLLIVKTHRPRTAFVKDISKIMELLEPARNVVGSHGNVRSALTFEAFFFAAEDARGPFAFTEYVDRSGEGGGVWTVNRCLYDAVHGPADYRPTCP
jgi:hypothetical protein